jgi:hypothetical protein
MKMTDQTAPESAADPANTGQKLNQRNGRGQFIKGSRANPRGKPRGARHRTTKIAESALAANAKDLLDHAIELALGDRGGPTLRALLPFLIAPERNRPMTFTLPELKEPGDSLRALDAIAAGIATGQLTETEATALVGLVGRFIDAIQISDHDKRLEALEQQSKEQSHGLPSQ